MAVEGWDPGAAVTLGDAEIRRFLAAARAVAGIAGQGSGEGTGGKKSSDGESGGEEPSRDDSRDDAFGLSAADVAQLAPLARQQGAVDWAGAGEGLADADIEALIRFFTLAEKRFPAWESASRSPVVPLAALLKKRGVYPADLTAWIKANTDNRFLPYGSLLDRL